MKLQMSLRAYFAGQALSGLAADVPPLAAARQAVQYADALLAELQRSAQPAPSSAWESLVAEADGDGGTVVYLDGRDD